MTDSSPHLIVPLQTVYDLGAWRAVDLLPTGKSQHFRLRTDRGVFVVRRSYRAKTVEGVRFEHELIAHLRTHGFPAPEVVPARDGATHVVLDDRIHAVTVFVDGTPFEPGNAAQLAEVARILATYHRIVTSFRPEEGVPPAPLLHDSLRERLAAMPMTAEIASLLRRDGQDRGTAALYEAAAAALDEGERALATLDALYPEFPRLVIHASCRRGSALFARDRLRVMLDFDSAHAEARAVDLAVAIHDFAKVYGPPERDDFKVPLDLGVVASFLSAYQAVMPLEATEIAALPSLLVARRLKRALGRFHRLFAGEPLSAGDRTKMRLEHARVRWMEAHRADLSMVLDGVSPR